MPKAVKDESLTVENLALMRQHVVEKDANMRAIAVLQK